MIGISMVLFKWCVSYRWADKYPRNGENLLYRLVQSCDYEAEISQQAHGVVLYRNSNHQKIGLQVLDKFDGPCLDLKSYKENPEVGQGGKGSCVRVSTSAGSYTYKEPRGGGLYGQ
jgi:hypothetical protein